MCTHAPRKPEQTELDKISNVLVKYGVSDSQKNPFKFNTDDFIILKNILIDRYGKIEEAIINTLFSPVKDEVFFHYTSTEAALNILKENRIRFYSISKRLNENELEKIDDFSIDFNYRETLAQRYFYLSLTNTDLSEAEEEHFYSTFASCGGSRLKIHLKCTNIMCRKIHYTANVLQLFQDLNDLCKGFGYTGGFVVNQMSRFCAYYLPLGYQNEKETRALYINNFDLVKKFFEECEQYVFPYKEIKPQFKEVKSDVSGNHYVEFELGKNDFGYLFEVLEVNTLSDQICNFKGLRNNVTPRK